MATIKLQGNASGSGSVTLTAPNTNSARTVTLPDEDIDLGNIGGAGTAKAWVTFVGSGVVSITDDGNVSSLTDSGVGSYTLAFTTALSSATYATTATCRDNGTDAASRPKLFVSKGFSDTVSSTTGELIVTAQSNSAEESDSPLVCCTWTN